jgi:hypothetical protein
MIFLCIQEQIGGRLDLCKQWEDRMGKEMVESAESRAEIEQLRAELARKIAAHVPACRACASR